MSTFFPAANLGVIWHNQLSFLKKPTPKTKLSEPHPKKKPRCKMVKSFNITMKKRKKNRNLQQLFPAVVFVQRLPFKKGERRTDTFRVTTHPTGRPTLEMKC